ncbi:MAG: NADH:flavin oxidoreductase [Candidatus Aminicenantes bacterium]|nr:NADH:flavin oxidoreductase [Candidatus Aminicenantes bacterium]
MKKQTNKPAAVEILHTPLQLKNLTIKNRFIRSATCDGYGDRDGNPTPEAAGFFSELARGGVGAIITGFAYISIEGRSMHPLQYGIDSDDKIAPWREIVNRVRRDAPLVTLIMQIAHCGRQTRREKTGRPVVGVSSKKCTYYRQRVKTLDDAAVEAIIEDFGRAAGRAKEAGFDAVQLHGAHGYLIHQFLSPWTNKRRDCWAGGNLFVEKIIEKIRENCGGDFPILVKLSHNEDNVPGVNLESTIATVKKLEELQIDAVEISCGTSEYALNTMRGACPINTILKVNPMFNRIPQLLQKAWKKFYAPHYLKRFLPFEENYNEAAAAKIKKETALPVIPVGGLRTAAGMVHCLSSSGLDGVSLCRPLLREPDFPARILSGETQKSTCINCNLCTAHVDSLEKMRCYHR